MEIETLELTFQECGFSIHKKELLNFNVKYAMQLDQPRVEEIIASISSNRVIKKFLRNFLAEAEESKTYKELGNTKDYICYVLK